METYSCCVQSLKAQLGRLGQNLKPQLPKGRMVKLEMEKVLPNIDESGGSESKAAEKDPKDTAKDEQQPTLAEAEQYLADQQRRNLRARAKAQATKPDRIRKPSVLQCLFHQKQVARSVYYFTSGRKVDPELRRDVTTEPTPFWFPPDTQEFSYKVLYRTWHEQFRKQQAAYPVSERPTYRSRQKIGLLERLYVPDETLDMPVLPAVLDIDPEYFSIVQGRSENKKRFDIQKYIDDMKQTIRVRMQAGYNLDQVLQLDEQFLQEQKRIDRITEKYKLHSDNLDLFISEKHMESMKALRKSELLIQASETMDIEYKRLEQLLGVVRCRVYILEELWRECKMFQNFLYHVSPLWWQEKNIIRSNSNLLIEDAEASLFGRYRLASSGTIASLESLINMFKEDTENEQPPQLYFTEPSQLLAVFESMERQNLNSILHLEELSVPLNNMLDELEKVKTHFEHKEAHVSEKVFLLKQQIAWEVQRASNLKDEAHGLIDGLFRSLIIDDDVLNLYIFVEDAYEANVALNDNNMGLLSMTRALESSYKRMLSFLDDLPAGVVRNTETEMYAEEARRMHVAMEATRRVHQMSRLKERLHRALEPPLVVPGRRLMFRSRPQGLGRHRQRKKRELTQDELDFLDFFTEYCRYTDDSQAYLNANTLPKLPAIERRSM